MDGERMPDRDSVAGVESGCVGAEEGREGAACNVSDVSDIASDSWVSAANSSKAFSAQSGRSPSSSKKGRFDPFSWRPQGIKYVEK